MTFAFLSAAGVLLGVLALAGLLAVLQRLKVQHREVAAPLQLSKAHDAGVEAADAGAGRHSTLQYFG